jgi:hypothetical protein
MEDDNSDQQSEALQYYDDVSDFTDTRSMMSHRTMQEIDYIPPDCDLDLYIEEMLKNKNKRMIKQLELKHEQQLNQLRHQIDEEDKRIFTDQAKADLAELRYLNAMDLNDLIGHKDDFDTVSTQSRK